MKSSGFRIFLLLIPISLLAGCYSNPMLRSGPPAATASLDDSESLVIPEYQLGFGDVIEIKFFNNERFNETVAVRPDGRISLEKVGEILVTGMTARELDSLVTATYAQFLRRPEITVFVRQFGGYQVYVLGEVNSPGGYPLMKEMTVTQALATAGGAKESASLGSVILLRRGRHNEIDAKKIDLGRFVKGQVYNFSTHDPYVRAQDIVYVPKTFVASASSFLDQIYRGLLPPIEMYLRALWWSRR